MADSLANMAAMLRPMPESPPVTMQTWGCRTSKGCWALGAYFTMLVGSSASNVASSPCPSASRHPCMAGSSGRRHCQAGRAGLWSGVGPAHRWQAWPCERGSGGVLLFHIHEHNAFRPYLHAFLESWLVVGILHVEGVVAARGPVDRPTVRGRSSSARPPRAMACGSAQTLMPHLGRILDLGAHWKPLGRHALGLLAVISTHGACDRSVMAR